MRIWVARPEPGATRTAERLIALGHAPLVAPVLTVERTRAKLPAGDFAGLVLTSANAVAALDGPERRRLGRVPVFAVGSRTAALAREAGFTEIHEAAGDAAGLAALARAVLPPESVLLHIAGADRKVEPAASLEAAGHRVVAVAAYVAKAAAVLPERVAAALDGDGAVALDAALHYSRRSAATARDLAEAANRSGAFRALKHYCLSEDVAVPLVAAGVAVHFVPERPSEDALLAGLFAIGVSGA